MIDQALHGRGTEGFDSTAAHARATGATVNGDGTRLPAVWSLTCHYCGFDPRADATPTRCPKCGASAWELTPVPGSLLAHAGARPAELPAGAARQRRRADAGDRTGVVFRVRCTASQVYLFFGPDSGRLRMLPLHQEEQDEWETRLLLPPGAYKYRFYIDDGTRLICFAAPDATGAGSRFEGRLLVPNRLGECTAATVARQPRPPGDPPASPTT